METSPTSQAPLWRLRLHKFLHTESSSAIVLFVAALLALVWANSPWSASYQALWHLELGVRLGDQALTKSLHHWINDGLMTIFFFVAGLEIKRELTTGRLSDPRAAALPILGAMGGMAAPALIYAVINFGGAGARGWAMPMATDIAFAVGVLALLGDRVPTGLKAFLLTLAIVDDLGAIAVIAVFYSSGLQPLWLLGVAVMAVLTLIFQKTKVNTVGPYIPLGVIAWFCALQSGIHPTLAGVLMGLLTPSGNRAGRAVLDNLVEGLHPWSSFVIMPLFALANAGVAFEGSALTAAFQSPVAYGVVGGLVLGKLVGIAGAGYGALALGVGKLPDGVRRAHLPGVSLIAGIGFTVSLFIASLSFAEGSTEVTAAKLGVFLGSLIAGGLGVALLLRVKGEEPAEGATATG